VVEGKKYKILYVASDLSTKKESCPFNKLENEVTEAINKGFTPYGELKVIYNGDTAAYDGLAPFELIQVVVKNDIFQDHTKNTYAGGVS